jgi:hypothetical protein
VTTLSKFSKNPSPAHWEAAKRVLWYLARTTHLWLSYSNTKNGLVGYADADGSMAEDWCAMNGYVFILNGGAVSWSCKKQDIVSLSMMESEYIAATHVAKETLWLHSLTHIPSF